MNSNNVELNEPNEPNNLKGREVVEELAGRNPFEDSRNWSVSNDWREGNDSKR